MAKKIEEFTEDEILDVYDGTPVDQNWVSVVLDYIKANLDSGFEPDWSGAPKDAEGVAIIWNGVGPGCATYLQLETDTKTALVKFIQRPQQTKAPTREEKVTAIIAKVGDNGMLWEYLDEVIDLLYKAVKS